MLKILITAFIFILPLYLYAQSANEKLFDSIKKGDAKLAGEALKEGADINLTDKSNSRSVLMLAISFGQTETAKLLIEKGADLTAADSKGDTPLLIACANNRVELIKLLLAKGADPDKTNNDRHSAITKSLSKRFNETAKIIMEAGVPFKLTQHLFNAVARTRSEELILLLKEKSVHTDKDNEKFDKLLAKIAEDKQKKAAKEGKKTASLSFPAIAGSAIALVTIIGTAVTLIVLRKKKINSKPKKK